MYLFVLTLAVKTAAAEGAASGLSRIEQIVAHEAAPRRAVAVDRPIVPAAEAIRLRRPAEKRVRARIVNVASVHF